MLTKEPEMLQPEAFCEHTMQQNATAAGALFRTLLEELTAFPQTSQLVLRGPFHGRELKGKEGKGKGGEGRLSLMRSWNRAADWLRPALMQWQIIWINQYNLKYEWH